MKCPMCNGSGKCYEQKIRYQEIETNRTDFTVAKCHKCNGTGEVQMTNEEWFCQLRTEEKAEFLNLIIRVGPYENEPKDFWEHVYGRGGEHGAKSVVTWLKQPHSFE